MTETKEMTDADFQTDWVARMEECIGNREESAENRAPTPNRTRPGAGGEDGDDSENLPIADLSEKYGVAWQVHSCYIPVGKVIILLLLRSQHSMCNTSADYEILCRMMQTSLLALNAKSSLVLSPGSITAGQSAINAVRRI